MGLLDSASKDSEVEESVSEALKQARENAGEVEVEDSQDSESYTVENARLVSELESLKAKVKDIEREEGHESGYVSREEFREKMDELEERIQETEIEEKVTRSELENRIEQLNLEDKADSSELEKKIEELKGELGATGLRSELEEVKETTGRLERRLEEIDERIGKTEIEEKVDRSELDARLQEIEEGMDGEPSAEVRELRSQVEEISELLVQVSRNL
ncbi:MAG: hypothetical protein ABEJ98_02860 [Candidatus Nanohaloarchaea archaeon]